MAWHRLRLLSLVKAQRSRAANCIWVPFWLIFVAAAVTSFLSTADVPSSAAAYTFLQARLHSLGSWTEGGGVTVAGTTGLINWLQGAWLPALTDEGARAVIVGGLRLSQWRGIPGCGGVGLTTATSALLPAQGTSAACAVGTPLATAPYGPAQSEPPDSVSTRAFRLRADDGNLLGGLKNAYTAVLRSEGGMGAPTINDANAALNSLVTNQWLDAASVIFEGGALAVIPALRRWVYVTARITVDDGGVFSGTMTSCAVPIEAPGISFADVVFLVGSIFLTIFTLAHFRHVLSDSSLSITTRCGTYIKALRNESEAWWNLLGVLLDIGLIISVLTTIGLSSNAASAASALRTAAAAAVTGNAPSPSSTEMGTLFLHARAAAACDARGTWLEAAATTAFFVGARSVRLLSLSPRVGVVGAAFAASLIDVLHCGALIGAIFGLCVLFAHGAFGATAHSLSDPSVAAFALLRMVMFDVPYDAMSGSHAKLAAAFFALYMLLVTHALLWAWLGISLEAFSICRSELRDTAPRAPTLLDDASSGITSATLWVNASLRRGAPQTLSPWAQRTNILKALDLFLFALQPTPSSTEYITVTELSDALHSPPAAATRAAKAVSTCDDVSTEFREALLGIVLQSDTDGVPLSPPFGEEVFSPVDMAPLDVNATIAAPFPPPLQRTVSVRGVLIRVDSPPPMEQLEVDSPAHQAHHGGGVA